MAKKSGMFAFVLASMFLFMGTVSSVIGKVMYETWAPIDARGHVALFKKPWFQVWLMFVGMMMCGPLLAFQRFNDKREKKPLKPLASGKPVWKVSLLVGVPASCDLAATCLQNVALLWTNVSIWQMLRGSTCIFAAAQRYFYLGKRIRHHELLGIVLVTVGLVIVGSASLVTPSAGVAVDMPQYLKVAGIVCILCAQFMQAFQTVVEEELLHDIEADALFIVFMEGIWGTVLCSAVFMPLAQYLPGEDGDGVHEDVWPDEYYSVFHNQFLLIQCVIYLGVVLFFNVAGMRITEETQATTRNVLDAARTMCVWVSTLLLNFIAPQYGEPVGWFSYIEACGFVVLILGMFVYTDTVQLPCFRKQTSDAPAGMLASPGGDGKAAFAPASPKPVYSPIGARVQQNDGYARQETPVQTPADNDLAISLVQHEH